MAIRTRPISSTRRVGVIAVAVLAAVAVWAVAVLLFGVDLFVPAAAQTVGVGAFAVTALFAALLGWALLAALEHRSTRAHRIWRVTAVVVTLLSMAGPLTSAATTAVLTTLIVAHLAVATVLIGALPGGLIVASPGYRAEDGT